MKNINEPTDFSKYSNSELAEAFVFPQTAPSTIKEKQEEKEFWQQRRKQFESRSADQKIYGALMQLKFQLEDYVRSNQYSPDSNFGFFLNEYIIRQHKQYKQFANEIDITPAVLSQYLNNHRKPTERFVIRLELHSNEIITALTWFKLLQKDKEHEIMTDTGIRKEESMHIKNKLVIAY